MNSPMNNDLLNHILSDKEELEKCLKWLSSQKNEVGDHGFTKTDFVIFFLSYLRLQTASFFEQKRVKTKSEGKRVTPVTDKPTSSVKPLSTGDTVRRLFSPESENGLLVSPIKQRTKNADDVHYGNSYQNTRTTPQQLFNPQTGIYDQVNFSMNQPYNYSPIHNINYPPIRQASNSNHHFHRPNVVNSSMNQPQNYALIQQQSNSNYPFIHQGNNSNVFPSQIQGGHGNVVQGVGQVMSPPTQAGPWSNIQGVGQVLSPLNQVGPWSKIQSVGQIMSPNNQAGPWSNYQGVGLVMSPTKQGVQRSNSIQSVSQAISPPTQTGPWGNVQGVGLVMSPTKQGVQRSYSVQGLSQVMSPTTQGVQRTNSIQNVSLVISPPTQAGPWSNTQSVSQAVSPTTQGAQRTNSIQSDSKAISPTTQGDQRTNSIQGVSQAISPPTRAGPWSNTQSASQAVSPTSQDGQRTNTIQDASQVTYHTPRRTNFHSNNSLLFSNSSSSSGVLSPESPRDFRKFGGSEERGRRGAGGGGGGGASTPKNPCIGDFIVSAINKKQDKRRKRIKPTRLSMSSGHSQMSDVSNVSKMSSNVFTSVPESTAVARNQSDRASNFDEERKLLKQYNKQNEVKTKNTSKTRKETSNEEQQTPNNSEIKNKTDRKKTPNKLKPEEEEGIVKEESSANKNEVKPKEDVTLKEECTENEKENICKTPPKTMKPKEEGTMKEVSSANKNEVKFEEEVTLKQESSENMAEKVDMKTVKRNNLVPDETKFIRPDENKNKVKSKEELSENLSGKLDTKTLKETNLVPNEPKFIRPDPSKVTNPSVLRKLAKVYCVLLDNNLVFNVTTEIHFIIGLLAVKVAAKRTTGKQVDGEKFDENSAKPEENVNTPTSPPPPSLPPPSSPPPPHPHFPPPPPHPTSSPPPPPPPPPPDSDKDENLLGVDKLESCVASPPPPPPPPSSPPPPPGSNKDKENLLNDLLSDVHNIVYFACYVLENQLKFLQLLDRRTLKSLAENQKIELFAVSLKRKIKRIHSVQIPATPKPLPQTTTVTDPESGICPVQFHAETDNRWTFSSDNSFATFRKQRDELYSILQTWSKMQQVEGGVAGGGAKFNKVKSRVEKLLAMSQDPINVRHLAKHFCDLLLRAVVTCEENTIEELENLPDVNKSKLTLLTKRLTEPSSEKNASPRPETNFPGFQQFYHDFLVIAGQNYLFNVHLINCFVNEITVRSGATYDIDESEGEGRQVVQEETRQMFVQGLSALCVLAKFLGLVVFAPYRSSSEISKSVLQKEINIRKQLDAPLKLDAHLDAAARRGSLVYTVPWIVEYLGMMDAVAPHLPNYENVLVTLFNIYLLCSPQRSIESAEKGVEKNGNQEENFVVKDGIQEKFLSKDGNQRKLGLKDGIQEEFLSKDGNQPKLGLKDGIQEEFLSKDGIERGKLVDKGGILEKVELEDGILEEYLSKDEIKRGKLGLKDVNQEEFIFKNGNQEMNLVEKDGIQDKLVSKDGNQNKFVYKDGIQKLELSDGSQESTSEDENQDTDGIQDKLVDKDKIVEESVSKYEINKKSLSNDGIQVLKEGFEVENTISKDETYEKSVLKDVIRDKSVSKDEKSVSKNEIPDEFLSEYETVTKLVSKEVSEANRFECQAEFLKKIFYTERDSSSCGRVIALSPLVSAFLRLCLGWLFDSANLSQEVTCRVALRSDVDRFLAEKFQTTRNKLTMDSCSDLVTHEIIHKFCPYLKSFHALLAKKNSPITVATVKHVTPISSSSILVPSASSTPFVPPEIAIQLQLEDHFFMGRPESVKRTVEFVAERIASACIKEVIGGVVVLLKKKVTDAIERDSAQNKKVDLQPLIAEYKWRAMQQLAAAKESRLSVALKTLLGPDVGRQSLELCQLIAARKFQERVVNWLQTHINIEEILTKVLTNHEKEHKSNNNNDEDDALEDFFKVEKLEPNKINEEDTSGKAFSIDEVTVCSKTLIHIQDIASDALESFGKQGIKSATETLQLLSAVERSLKQCPSHPIKKQICTALLDYVILMISFQPDQATDDVIDRLACVIRDGGLEVSHLWSQRNVMLLFQGSHANVWRRFSQLTVALVDKRVLEITSLEQQVVALFRCTWPDNVLQTLSDGIRCTVTDLKKKTSCDPEFLELLSDIATDISGDFQCD